MLGKDLMAVAMAGWDWAGVDLPELDITRLDPVREWVQSVQPSALVNVAAFTQVDACESREEDAAKVNAIGAKNLAIACRETGAHFVHLSTDYVFDGLKGSPYVEDDPPHPLNAYGRTKLWGETLVKEVAGVWSIVRTQWLFGIHGPNFIEKILQAADKRPALRVVADQKGCPTHTVDLAGQLTRIIQERLEGTIHASSQGECSWCDLARLALDLAGKTQVGTEPIPTSDYPLPAPRPLHSVLQNRHLALTIGDSMPAWEDAVRGYMKRRPS